MKNICLVTNHPFWSQPQGCGTLIRARYNLFSKLCDSVCVLYITNTNQKNPLRGGTLKINKEFTSQDVNSVKDFIKSNNINFCYFSYDHFSFLNDSLSCKTAVEIHDVIHLRQEQFEKFGYKAPFLINKNDELDSLKKYNYVFSLNINEVDYLKKNNVNNAIYLPPNINFTKLPKPKEKNSFGLIGSLAKPNIDGFNLLSNILSKSAKFVIAGPMATNREVLKLIRPDYKNLGIVKFPQEFYSEINLALSPIRFGGGLKIKVFEALSFGRSLITTNHSIDGFPKGIEEIVTINDDINKWDTNILLEALNKESQHVEQYFLEYFRDDACSSILSQII